MNSSSNNILLIDKPEGITSFDVIRRLRKKLGIKKMGHAGTLDPLATGLLIVGVGDGTKKLRIGSAETIEDGGGNLLQFLATLAPFVGYIIGHYFLTDLFDISFTENRGPFIFTVLFTTVSWLLATFLTKPSEHTTLLSFYNLVKPDGNWKPFQIETKDNTNLLKLFVCWISSITLTYSLLFFTGKLILMEYIQSFIFLLSAIISFLILRYFLIRTNIFNN